MNDLQRAVHDRELAEGQVKIAIGQVMVAERVQKSTPEVYAAVRRLTAALMASAEATRRLANVLSITHEAFSGLRELDEVLPPIIDHEGDPNACECDTGERTPLNCWNCSAND